LKFGGLQNISWLVFLVPITTLGRYYSSRASFSVAAGSWLFIILAATGSDLLGYWSFGCRSIEFGLNGGVIDGISFMGYLNQYGMLGHWDVLKQCVVIGAVFFVVVMIYAEETRDRLGSIFRFGHMLYMAVREKPASPAGGSKCGAAIGGSLAECGVELDERLLNFLCVETNVEAVIAVQEDRTDRRDVPPVISAVFQTHGMRTERFAETPWVHTESLRAYYDFTEDLDRRENRIAYCSPTFHTTMQSLQRSLHRLRSANQESIVLGELKFTDDGMVQTGYGHSDFWVFGHPSDQNWLRRFREVFFQSRRGEAADRDDVPARLLNCRERAHLYKDFVVVSLIVMRIRGWRLFFVNNLPHNYRVVPRTFWSDGIEKVQVAKFLLDRCPYYEVRSCKSVAAPDGKCPRPLSSLGASL
jgi:hypothetical protein